jgi:hypothetical protein
MKFHKNGQRHRRNGRDLLKLRIFSRTLIYPLPNK